MQLCKLSISSIALPSAALPHLRKVQRCCKLYTAVWVHGECNISCEAEEHEVALHVHASLQVAVDVHSRICNPRVVDGNVGDAQVYVNAQRAQSIL